MVLLMGFIIFAVCLCASTIGGICGIGGGVIIKPVLDALGLMSVSAISFLSGISAMMMAAISVFRQRKLHLVEVRTGSLLAVGSIVGGIAGYSLFQAIRAAAQQDALVGMVQAILLGLVTLLTLVYSAFLRSRLRSYEVKAPAACIAIGCLMGLLSSFLGIGGGPINLAILYFAFSMTTKKAAANSLYIILCSQLANLVTYLVRGTVPAFPWPYLLIMAAAGFLGGMLGTRINRRISEKTTERLFSGLLAVIVLICVYNALRFAL